MYVYTYNYELHTYVLMHIHRHTPVRMYVCINVRRYLPDVVNGAKMSTCPWCDDDIRCNDNDFINIFTFLSSLRDRADK